jgi:hypothetical protein
MEFLQLKKFRSRKRRRNNMNFMDAYAKTIGKETPPAPKPETPAVTSDDVKAYVDAKMADLKKEMQQIFQESNKKEETVPNKVETPEETPQPIADNNIEKEGD